MKTSTHTTRLARMLTVALVAGTIAAASAVPASGGGSQSPSVADLIVAQEQARLTEAVAETPSVADLIVAQERARLGMPDGRSALPARISAPQGFDWRDAWIGIGAVLLLSALLAAGVKAGGRRSRTAGA